MNAVQVLVLLSFCSPWKLFHPHGVAYWPFRFECVRPNADDEPLGLSLFPHHNSADITLTSPLKTVPTTW